MRYIIAYVAFLTLISAGFFHALSSTLTDMTRRDRVGGQA